MSGERLPGSKTDRTQNFLMVNGPAFLKPTAKNYLTSLKLLAATTDKAQGLKKVLSAALRGTETLLEAAGGDSGTIKGLGGEPATHPLGETYYSQVPLLYGHYVAKLSLAPVSRQLQDLKSAPIKVTGHPNALREAMIKYFSLNDAVWELRAHLCRDLERMPIEDASVRWPEELSPYLPIAFLTVSAQAAWNQQRSAAVDEDLSFSPWHGISSHRPLGSVMRMRKRQRTRRRWTFAPRTVST